MLTCIEQATKYLTDKLYLFKSFIYMYLWLKALKSDIESLYISLYLMQHVDMARTGNQILDRQALLIEKLYLYVFIG